jgi:hypothetical protein
MMAQLSAIEPLNGGNYGLWRETIKIALALWDINLALTTDPPIEPTHALICKVEAQEAFATHQQDFAPIRMQCDHESVKWESSNCKCMMVIKSSILEAIRGAIRACETSKEYLKKVKSQFTFSSKAYASTIIKRLVNEKYTRSGVREHILKMSNMASKLKPMDIWLRMSSLFN